MDSLLSDREAFIESHLNLVHSLCRRFTGRGVEYDDLFQAGCMGLVKAADAFDASRGFCFSTYAVPVILGEIRRLFRDGGAVKVSRSLKELALRLHKERFAFEQENGREPVVSELAQRLGCSTEEVTQALCASQPTVSLTASGEDGVFENDIPVEGPEAAVSDRLTLLSAMQSLEPTEQSLIRYRYFLSFTQSKTAAMLGMTQVQVSRSEKKILKKLRGLISA